MVLYRGSGGLREPDVEMLRPPVEKIPAPLRIISGNGPQIIA